MSTMALSGGLSRTASLYQSVIGKKIIMAVTGVVLFAFVLGHMIGNLQIYAGPAKLNHYAEALRAIPALLWGVRAVMLTATVLHILMAVQLTLLKWDARPVAYVKKAAIATTYAARTMIWSGPILGAFIIYHLLQLTFGTFNPSFEHTTVYEHVVTGFQNPVISFFYLLSMVMLCLHLYHGLWSMFQTVGVSHPRYTPWLKRFSALFALVICAGNCSIPLAVLTGLVR